MSRKDEAPSLVLRIDTLNAGALSSFEMMIAQQIGRKVKVEIGHLEVDGDNRVGVWVFSMDVDLPPYFRPLSAYKLGLDLPDVISYLELEIGSLLIDIVAREKNVLPLAGLKAVGNA